MSLNLISLSSGSRGNSILVFSENTCVVIDAGIPMNSIKRGLKSAGHSSASVLLTHTHTDHVGGLTALSRELKPQVFCHAPSYYGVEGKMAGGELNCFDGDFYIGDLTISPFRVSHDVPCVGYSIYNQGKKISVLTDLGCITEPVLSAIAGSDIVLLEANHDEQLLKNNTAYPEALKRRILSGRGHLSNTEAAEAAVYLAENGTKRIVLAHLSEENNYPELAYAAVSNALKAKGVNVGFDIHLDVAGYNKLLGAFKLA